MRRTGVYYVRVRIPKDMAEVIGTAEIRRSLKTSDSQEAKHLLRIVMSEIQAEFAAARHRTTDTRALPMLHA
jgi:hypothetical protein